MEIENPWEFYIPHYNTENAERLMYGIKGLNLKTFYKPEYLFLDKFLKSIPNEIASVLKILTDVEYPFTQKIKLETCFKTDSIIYFTLLFYGKGFLINSSFRGPGESMTNTVSKDVTIIDGVYEDKNIFENNFVTDRILEYVKKEFYG